MHSSDLEACELEWQRAVREHESMAREARRAGLSPKELDKISQPYLLRVDVAYARLKLAEADSTGGAMMPPSACSAAAF
jgi:hypothetical protein